jgi:beta-lactamase class A
MIQRLALLSGVLAMAALFLACRESDGPVPTQDGIAISPVPSVRPTATPTPEPRRVSLGELAGDAEVPALPSPFAEPMADPDLEALIVQTLGDDLPSYSVVVQHLADGRSAAVGAASVYNAASLFKLEVLLQVYRQRDEGEIDFSQELELTEEYVEYDLNTLELLGLEEGDLITVADAISAMIVVSDTPTAVMLQDLVGPVRIEQMLRSLGLSETYYNTDLPTSARDMALLIRAIATGDGVSDGSRLEMLSLLLQERIREGIPAGVPADTAVAHKTGNLINATHDVAIVWGPGGPYVIAVLSDQAWRWGPIVAVSQAVYDYFATSP